MDHTAVEEIELEIDAARETIEFGEAIDRLTNNADFEKVVLKGYFETEARNQVAAKAAPALQGDDQQAKILKAIDGIGALQQWFQYQLTQAAMAKAAMDDHRQELAEMESAA